jgi:hypothetical protein
MIPQHRIARVREEIPPHPYRGHWWGHLCSTPGCRLHQDDHDPIETLDLDKKGM